MRAKQLLGLVAVSAVLVVVAGCGLDITIEGSSSVAPGGTANFDITLKNVSSCPLIELTTTPIDFELLTMLPASTVESSDFLSFLCGTGPLPPPARSTALAAQGDLPWDDARAELKKIAAAAAASAQCSGMGVTCESVSDSGQQAVICDTGPVLAPGEMRMLQCSAQVPVGNGPFYTVAFSAMIASGVCEAGTAEAGQACLDASDCGMGGSCSPGICVGGTNTGNGCTDVGDCPGMDTVCELCGENDAGLGFACFAQASAAAPAPSLAPWGIGVALLGLGAVAYRRFRRG